MRFSSGIILRAAFSIGLLLLAACADQQSTTAPASPTGAASSTAFSTLGPAAITPSPTGIGNAPTLAPSSSAPTLPSPSITAGAVPTGTSTFTTTVTLADDGKTIDLASRDHLLLDLGAGFTWQAQAANPDILVPVSNQGSGQNQISFVAQQPGQTTLTANGTPTCYTAVPRCLTPSRQFRLFVTVGSAPNSPLSLTVTLADDGKELTMRMGQRMLLALGDSYNWTATVDDPAILAKLTDLTGVKGAQGIYEAKQAGRTVLKAAGTMVCPQGQVCPMIARAFKVQVVVQ